MWIWIDIEESRIDQVKPGQSVWFELRGLKGEIHEGRVDWIDTAVNTLSRTIRVRAIVENADSHLRAMQFGIARIATSPEETIVVVPRIAVQRRTAGETVFVRLDPTGFQARPVQSFEIDQEHELGIKSGVSPGDEVVTEGAFLLKNELENDAADGDAP
jgi:cobalt-zinc-cadmium efflux system membrane fusion protein